MSANEIRSLICPHRFYKKRMGAFFKSNIDFWLILCYDTLIFMEIAEQNLTKKQRRELRRQEKLAARELAGKKRKTTSALLWAFVIVFMASTIILAARLASKNPATDFVGGEVRAADDSDWIKGAPLTETKVILTEYSDFQCPACAAYYPMIKKLGQEFKNLSIVYRHFPLPQHANAATAAQAAESAGRQGKFWEMHDLLFENQNAWSGSSSAKELFIAYAQSLSLDLEKFKIDFDAPEIKTKIQTDYQSGAAEIDGTPTFFLNNKKIENPRSYDEFRNIIQQAGGNL